jgi:hypothetical protein
LITAIKVWCQGDKPGQRPWQVSVRVSVPIRSERLRCRLQRVDQYRSDRRVILNGRAFAFAHDLTVRLWLHAQRCDLRQPARTSGPTRSGTWVAWPDS